MRFKDKVAIVVGASQGIGEAIAVALAAEGAQVVAWDVNEQGVQETVKKIQAQNGKAKAAKMDGLDYIQVKAGVDQVVNEFGKLDIITSTVGGGKHMPFKNMTPEFFKQQVSYNLDSVFNCANAALAPMLERDYGKMLFFTSAFSEKNLCGYTAGKAAVQSLVQTITSELGMSKININIIHPGMTDTPLTRGFFANLPNGDELFAKYANRPHGLNKPEDVAKLALYLVSDDAERLTNQIIKSVV